MAQASFKGVSERFKVTLGNSDGQDERVTIQIGLDGLKVLDQGGTRTMKSYDLSHISRWQSTGNSLVLYTKTPVDVEERQLTLTADSTTIRNALDTLTCCCMQLVEILQSGRTQNELEAANNLHALVAGGGKKKSSPALPNADSIEYWRGAEKQGWLQSQAEVMKVWRKRWFVLKQGYLFRFLGSDVSESTKPRGVVDLSKVQDVRDGRAITGKPNSILLKTASGGSVCYITDSETEMVEWISALEGSIAKIVKLLAGVEEEARATTHNGTSSSKPGGANDWVKQVERNIGGKAGSSSSSGRHGGTTMVSVVGYEGGAASAPGASSSYYGNNSGGHGGSSGSYGGGGGSSGIDYSQIAGVAGVAAGGGAVDDMALNYGGFGGGGSAGGVSGPGGGGGYGGGGGGSSAFAGDAYGQGSYGAAAYGNGNSGYGYAAGAYDGNNAAGGSGYAGGGGGYGAPQQQQQPQQQGGYGAQPGYYAPQQLQQQQQLSSAPSLSLLDQVPSQQPAYPYYQPSMGQPQQQQPQAQAQQQQQQEYGAAPPPAPQQTGVWQVHYTAEGRPYYLNTATNATQWDAPPGM